MSEQANNIPEPNKPPRYEPAFNVPGVVLLLGAIMIAIQAGTPFLATDAYYLGLEVFAFIPASWSFPLGQLYLPASRFWSPVTYAFLHADWTHVLANLVWFASFGSAVARRLGNGRFLVFLVLATIASAAAHGLLNMESNLPMIGASGAVSGCMGAAVRFAFTPNARGNDVQRPALSLVQSLQNRGVLAFVVLWFVFNWLFGSGIVPLAGVENQIAWEAHAGGFIFGLLAFRLFDPVQT